MSFDDDEYSEPEAAAPSARESAEKSEIQSLRDDLAELKAQLSERLDPAEEVAVLDRRAVIRKVADRQDLAAAAAQDPRTLDALRDIESESELIKFMTDRGYGNSLIG